jgi:chaperonin cofactor prefoldin|tara:strand:+ start:141 stop:341 length:201 start_codon:yes stop_codon:yes gene_type:complete
MVIVNQLKNKLSKDKGTNDLEYKLELTQKEVDTLKDVINVKDFEISTLKEKIKELEKEQEDLLKYP